MRPVPSPPLSAAWRVDRSVAAVAERECCLDGRESVVAVEGWVEVNVGCLGSAALAGLAVELEPLLSGLLPVAGLESVGLGFGVAAAVVGAVAAGAVGLAEWGEVAAALGCAGFGLGHVRRSRPGRRLGRTACLTT